MKRDSLSVVFCALLALLTLACPVAGQEPAAIATPPDPTATTVRPETLVSVDTGVVEKILKSDLILLNNSRRYRLDNIRVPLERDAAAMDDLNAALLNKSVKIYTYPDKKERLDRYGVPLAHVVRDDGVWVQEDMVSRGIAWAYTSDSSHQMIDPLRIKETEARDQQRGFWSDPVYAVKRVNEVGNYVDSFQIVEGKILEVTNKRKTIFFNFGKDWKKDFTVKALQKDWYVMTAGKGELVFPDKWKGRTIRIRGWVQDNDGPMIELTNFEQIELLP